MSGGYTLNQIRDEISKCCVVVEGFPQGTDKQSFAHIFHHKRAKQVEDGLKWLILLQDQESAKEWVNRGKHKVFNFTLDIVAGTGTDIPDDWLQDDNAKNPEKSEPFDSKQDHTSSSGEPESMTSKIPLASGPQTATFEQNSSKSGVPPMYYPTYPSMPMADAMEPPSYDSHNFQYGSQSMQTPQSAQIHVLYSKEEKPSFDKCPVKTPAEDNLSNQKNIQEEKQTSDAYDSIKICNLPGSITDDSISDYFENVKRSGGGPVSKVIYDEERKTAFVTFEDPNVVKNVLKKHASSPLLMNKQQIEIEMYIPKIDMENDSQKIMAISVRNLPHGTNDEQIELFFENRKKSGGGEVEKVDYDENTDTAVVWFKEAEIVASVLQKHESSPLTMNKQTIEVEKYHSPQDDSGRKSEELDEGRKIKVTKLPKGISEEQLVLFFENYKKSGGGEVEKVEYDENTDTAIVWFEDAEVVANVLQKHESSPLTMNKQTIEVEKYHPPQEDSGRKSEELDEGRTIKVTKLPKGISEEQLVLFFENYKKSGGGEVEKVEYDENTDTAIVWFEDAEVVTSVLQKHESSPLTMNKQKIDVEEYHPLQEDSGRESEDLGEGRTIKVTKLPKGISEEQLVLFFENYKKSGGGEVEKVDYDENTDTAIVWFEDAEVVASVLQKHESSPLTMNKQTIEVEEYHPTLNDSDGKIDERRTIKVIKLPRGISEEQIILLFENYKKSGGGEVEKVEYDENTDTAIVWFEDAQVVTRVLQKHADTPLTMNKQRLDVEEYLPCKEEVENSSEVEQYQGGAIKITKLPQGTSEEQILLFFENRKMSGGGEVSEVKYDKDTDSAIVWFEDADVVTRVLQRIPLLFDKKQIYVEEVRLDGKSVEKEEEEDTLGPSCTIEVRGMKETTSKENIELYFDNKKKSGGGGVEEVRGEVEDGVLYITFENEKYVEQVLKQEHKVDGVILDVKLYLPPKPIPVYADRILITGFKIGTTKDGLTNFLEARTGEDVKEVIFDQEQEMAIIIFKEIKDFLKLEEICQKKPLEKHFLTVKKVPISYCIIVSGFAENTAESTIEFYFDNERRSGGGVVTDVKINKDDDTCLVYFEDHSVCDRVCQKSHTLENMKLTVHTFYECLGLPFNPEEGPKFRPVEPVVVKNLNLRKMKFVLSSTEYREVFDKQAESSHGKIKWPSKAATELTIECTLSKDIKDCRKLAKTWKDHMVDVINKLLEVLNVEAVNVLQEAWQKTLEEIQKLNVPDPKKVGIIIEKSNFTIVIVGYEKLFDDVKHDVSLIISKVVDEIELKKKQVKERVPLKRYQILLLDNDNFREATEKEFPNMKVTLDIQDKSVTFDGQYTDVSRVKLSVLQKCQQMCQASAGKFSKNRQEFLNRSDVNAKISKELKSKKNSSCFDFQKDELMCYAFSDDKAVEAAHLVKNYIAESPIDVQADSVYLLHSDKWKKQVKKLESSQDFEGLLMLNTEADLRKIVIVTMSEHVGLAREFVEDFLRDNTILKDAMEIPPSLDKFMELHHVGKLEQISESLKEQQVRIKKKNNKIDIEGTQKGLNRAKKNIEDFLKGIEVKKQKLEGPGIAKLLKSSSGKSKIADVEKNHKCYIQIGEDGSSDLSNFLTTTSTKKQKQLTNEKMTEYMTKEGVSIKVQSGDLTALRADVIVNAANPELLHQGGLAGVIVTKGGNEIQIECSDYVRRKGKLFEGDTFCSKAGHLSCKMIAHACGPTWRGGMHQESERLTDCVESALTETETRGYNSIAIPGLCTGIFGYPVNQATSVIVKAIKSYLRNRSGSTIEEIILCDVREDTVRHFNEAVKQEFKGKLQNVADYTSTHFQDGQTQSHVTDFKTGGIRVILVKGQIAQRKVDVIVNTAAKDLNLSQGAVSTSLLKLGGNDIQRECHSNYPNGIEFGDIAVTSGGKLNCENIFHGALPNWDKEKGVAKAGLQKFMKTCLTELQNKKFSSIAFPAFGTGNLGYPKDIVAEEMCNVIINFSKDNPDTCLKNVEFVIYEKDKVSIQTFEKEMIKRAKEVTPLKVKTQRKRHGGDNIGKTFGSDSQKEVSVDIGPIKLRMYQGDITLADVDAIVNGTDIEMDLSKGEVSKAIMAKLGVELQRQIDIQKKTMHEYGMAVTSHGDKSKLPSKFIIHVNLVGGNYKRKIMSVFQKAEEMGMKTIALPALGTGQQSFPQRNIEDFAQEVFDVLNKMSSDVKSLSEVHVIIFDHQQAVQFTVEMEKCFESQGSKPKGWFKGMVDAFKYYVTGGKSDDGGQWKPVLTDKPDDQSSVTIVVFADNQKNLDAGIRKLENLVNADFKTRDIRDNVIPHLSLDQVKALKNLEDEFDVEVNIDRSGGVVTLFGTSESLLDATSYVKDMLRNVDRNKLEAEYVSDVVMWYYVDNSDGKNELCDYPKNINLLVEKAYSNKQPDVKFLDVQGTQYTIDFSLMVEYPSDDPTDTVTVTRRDKIRASTFEPPPEWTAMSDSENLVVVQVPSGSQEYLKVIDRFQGELQTGGIKSDIIKLERIQNKMLYQQYVAKKKLLDSQNPPGTQNERELWHGTAPEAVNSVNSLGFNRSYCGKNAAVHGNGVYFAVDAEYSARETYSKPDPNGHKRIYLCKVLTGEYTLGKKDMRVPPAKDDNQPHILYDSVVYPLQDPEMFIIFNDTQGYPSYLITFVKNK